MIHIVAVRGLRGAQGKPRNITYSQIIFTGLTKQIKNCGSQFPWTEKSSCNATLEAQHVGLRLYILGSAP